MWCLLVNDEMIYRLSVYRSIGSVYRYRTDLEPISNLNSVFKKKYFFESTDFNFGIGSKSVDTDFLLILGSIVINVIFTGAGNEKHNISYQRQFDTDSDTDFIPISYRFQYRNRYRYLGISAGKYRYRYRIQNPIPIHH